MKRTVRRLVRQVESASDQQGLGLGLDVAVAVGAVGGRLADIGMLRAEPAVFGPVASGPTVSRLIDTRVAAGPKAPSAIRAARTEVRERVDQVSRFPIRAQSSSLDSGL